MKIRLNEGWAFSLGEPDRFAPVTLPHDWQIDEPAQWYQSAVGWYRRSLEAPFLKAGRRVFLQFDGVYMNATVFVNGHKAGEWKYGFTAFELDITEHLDPETENTLLVKVDARFPSARWYTGAGIYRPVHLVVKNPCHFVRDGIYITTHNSDGQWRYEVQAEVETGGQPYTVRHRLLEQGEIIPWSPGNPQLYTLRSSLFVSGQLMDVADTRFGFRELRFSPEEGFSINGDRMKLNGACLHQEFSIVGAAVHRDVIIRQVKALKRMGVNAVRTAHNPPSALFMDLMDEMGMMVVSEFADVWQISKTGYDYARYFDAWHQRDVGSWIRRDRNRPSIIMWSLGNEVPDTHVDAEKGLEVLTRLRDLVRSHDPEGQAALTLGSNYMPWENTQRCAPALDAVGYNYAEHLYDQHHSQYPDWVIYGSETCSTVQSRGIYRFPLSQPVLADDDLQTSALGNSATSWGAKSIDACIKDDRDRPFSLGHFIWTGQDYLGEPTPYHTKNSYFGMLDTAGFEKDGYYLFQSAWTDPATPRLHLFPHWDFNEGQWIDLRVASNQHAVALYLNDRSLGRQEMAGEITRNWRLPYEKGMLRAEAYDDNGSLTAMVERFSFQEAAQLQLEVEHGEELAFVRIRALDKQGRPVENANRAVRVRVKHGSLLGLDNGDASDYTPYPRDTRRLFSGQLLAVVKPEPGQEVQVMAEFCDEDIPVRKIELTREGFTVRARLLPEEAPPQELHWRLTNAAGVTSNLAGMDLHEDGLGITLRPRADGCLYVRCGVNNGKDHLDLYSQVSFDLSGLGEASLNPYETVSASLYTETNVPLTNGNERGVATPREGESWLCLDRLDFGPEGSDKLSVWLFPLQKEPFHFEIRDGRPDQGSSLLARPLYNLGMVWNTYCELPVRLNRRLTGMASLCFVFHMKTHMKGFQFHQRDRAYEVLMAGDCDLLYGDSYQQDGDWVRAIGNNTTLGFSGLRFTGKGARRIALTYVSTKAGSPLQLQFASPGSQEKMLLSLPANAGEKEQVFDLDSAVTGPQDVSLVFLPGASLDLHSLRFLQEE